MDWKCLILRNFDIDQSFRIIINISNKKSSHLDTSIYCVIITVKYCLLAQFTKTFVFITKLQTTAITIHSNCKVSTGMRKHTFYKCATSSQEKLNFLAAMNAAR